MSVESFTRSSLAAPILLAVLGFGFAIVPLIQGEMFFYWDNAQFQYPMTMYLHDALRAGELPQWWAQVGLGTPVVAEGEAAHYHPVHLLFVWLFPAPVAFMAEMGVYLAAAGVSAYFFLREFRLRRTACIVGGLSQMFGSYSIVSINNFALHRSFWLFPLAMLVAERYVRRQDRRGSLLRRYFSTVARALPMSVILGVQLLSGYPGFAIITLVATSTYILCRTLQRSWNDLEPLPVAARRLWDLILPWGLIATLGIGIAAIQFIPTLLHVEHSVRAGGFTFEYAGNSLHAKLRHLPQLILPYAYAHGHWPSSPNPWNSAFNEVPYAGIYLGTLPVVCAFLFLWWRPRLVHPGWALAICAVIATALALGGNRTPLFPALWSLPTMSGWRYPSRFLMWTSFCLACLGAFGIHRLLAVARLSVPLTGVLQPFVIFAVSILVLAVVFWTQQNALAPSVHLSPDLAAGLLTSLGLCVIALALAYILTISSRRLGRLLVILVPLFVGGDLAAFWLRSGYALTVPIEFTRTPPPVAAWLKTDPDEFRIMSLLSVEEGRHRNEDLAEFLQSNTSMTWGIETADFRGSLLLKRYYALHEAILWELTHSPDGARALAGFLGALNVKYIVAPNSVALHGWERVFETPRGTTWKNPAILPRAFLVDRAVPEALEVRDEWFYKATYQRLEEYRRRVSRWDIRVEDSQIIDNILARPVDYRNTAVVAMNHVPTDLQVDGSATVRALAPPRQDRMRFETSSSGPALLVISNNHYPGWTATVNGQPSPLYRANYVSMAVRVPSGRSEVELQFVTPGFRIGVLGTLLSLGVALAIWIVARRQRRVRS
ncbi:MAG: YfhO family protein [Vicinamibacterales bacterium]